MAIKHGRKNAKPKHSNSPQQQMMDAGQQQPFVAPPVPPMDAPGQGLGFNPQEVGY